MSLLTNIRPSVVKKTKSRLTNRAVCGSPPGLCCLQGVRGIRVNSDKRCWVTWWRIIMAWIWICEGGFWLTLPWSWSVLFSAVQGPELQQCYNYIIRFWQHQLTLSFEWCEYTVNSAFYHIKDLQCDKTDATEPNFVSALFHVWVLHLVYH